MLHLVREGVDRRVLLPLLVCIALTLVTLFLVEARRSYTRELAEVIQIRQYRLGELAELIYVCLEAESAQRGYLLTRDAKYAEPYESGRLAATQLAARLVESFSRRNSEELVALQAVQRLIAAKFAEMDETLGLMRAGRPRAALETTKTDVGLHRMREIRDDLQSLRSRERDRIIEAVANWSSEVRVNRWINVVGTVVYLAMMILVGLLASNELRRRRADNKNLDSLVSERTAELESLSAHMLKLGEMEKSALARGLHDELGGLLVAMRMDLSQLRRRVVLPDEDAQTRWKRLDDALIASVELKRRIIEELRPTLLDNLGLVAAVRWQAEQSTAVGGIKLEVDLPQAEPVVKGDTAIAIFRCVQEALANILQHARATRVKLSMQLSDHRLHVTIEDNGVGLSSDASRKPVSHGLKQMGFRMRAVGGEMRLASTVPQGTCTIFSVPIQPPQ